MKYLKISDFAEVITGGTPSTENKDYWENGTIPWLQSGCCQNCFVNSASKYITQAGYDNSSTKMMPENSVLIALTGATAGKVGILSFSACGNQSITGICPNSLVKQKFLFYYLIYLRPKILADCVGGAQPHISQNYVKNILVPIYSQKEQEDIIEALDSIYDIQRKSDECLAFLGELIRSKFNEMFADKNYPKTTIRNVVDTRKVSSKKVFKNEDEIKYIDISSIDNVANVVTGYTVYKFRDAPSRAQQCLKTNDILISTVRPNLKNIAIFPFDGREYVGSSGFCVLRALKCNAQFLKYVVLDEDFTESMVKLTTGASYPAIRDDDVLNYEMIQPPIDLQNGFGSFVESIDRIKTLIRKRLELLEELLNKKMDDYFGE